MLDKLLGRAELKARIEELEDENHHLERQLDAESDRRADAVSDKQAAEERINRLEDRITELEDRVERSEHGDEPTREPRHTESLRGDRLAGVLDRLESVKDGPEGALSAAITDDTALPEAVTTAAGGDVVGVIRGAAPTLYYADDAGVISAALRPPILPAAFTSWAAGFEIDRAWFKPPGRLVVGTVRADVLSAGVYAGCERTDLEGLQSTSQPRPSQG